MPQLAIINVNNKALIGFNVFDANGNQSHLDENQPIVFTGPTGVTGSFDLSQSDRDDLGNAGFRYGVWVQSEYVGDSFLCQVSGDPDLDDDIKQIVGTFELGFAAPEAASFGFALLKEVPKVVTE